MSNKIDVLRTKILNFLATNPQIRRINFSFKTYKVYPQAYQRDIYNAIKKKDIEIEFDPGLLRSNVGAKYRSRYLFFADDKIMLSPLFSISKLSDQATLIHECTHAHIDNQGIGSHSAHDDESVAYIAGAVFTQASKSLLPAVNKRTLGINNNLNNLQKFADGIAQRILSGLYVVSPADATALVSLVKPLYPKKTTYPSNGV